MKYVLLGVSALLLCVVAIYAFDLDKVFHPSMTPQEALERLIAGNNRYVEDKTLNDRHSSSTRAGLVSQQMPFAVILGCSDSRVPPELLFDQGVGDIFVVRVAGNVSGDTESASIGYAVNHLKAKLILVLGHENCGAIKAVLNNQTEGIEPIAKLIKPAIEDVCQMCSDRVENAVKMNVRAVVKQLQKDPHFAPLIRENKLDIVGGYYNLKSGYVEFLDKERKPLANDPQRQKNR
jgi:carbonic anhydrase